MVNLVGHSAQFYHLKTEKFESKGDIKKCVITLYVLEYSFSELSVVSTTTCLSTCLSSTLTAKDFSCLFSPSACKPYIYSFTAILRSHCFSINITWKLTAMSPLHYYVLDLWGSRLPVGSNMCNNAFWDLYEKFTASLPSENNCPVV